MSGAADGRGQEDASVKGIPVDRDQINPDSIDSLHICENNSGHVFLLNDSNENVELFVDPENVEDESREESLRVFWELHSAFDGFIIDALANYILAYKRGNGDEYIDRVCQFYEGKVPHEYLMMIEDSMMLRLGTEEFDSTLDEIRDRKRQIKETYENHDAYAVASLCSAGYLDRGGLFWTLYEEKIKNGEYTDSDYEEWFLKYVRKTPFVVFVKREDSAMDVYDALIGRSWRMHRYDVDFDYIHIRGRGPDNHKTINEMLTSKEITENHPNLIYEKEIVDGELIVNIDPNSI
ncbi:hypothetical protein [Halorubrum sp. C191]|uniref:hypothetical protein n=1 Tax=Halorubrum sp. C191 TaxID=1383842 RepID=UPI0011402E32|nr:hypothetical protein [Halorubrum sp. C191]